MTNRVKEFQNQQNCSDDKHNTNLQKSFGEKSVTNQFNENDNKAKKISNIC